MGNDELLRIKEIIANKSFITYMQPIYSLSDMELFAYEFLNRPLEYDTELFYSNVLKYNLTKELDEIVVQNSIKLAETVNETVFINIFPASISMLNYLNISSSKFVFELSEKANIIDFKTTRTQIEKSNMVIALDDFGSDYSGIKNIIELKPYYIKIDRYLVDGVDTNLEKQDIIRLLVNYCIGKHELIAEGIENPRELNFLKNVGVKYGQGFLIGKPKQLQFIG